MTSKPSLVVKKAKAHASALSRNMLEPIVSDLLVLSGRPFLGLACKAVTGAWGYLEEMAKQDLYEFVELLRAGNVTDEDVRTKDFRVGMELTYDQWMKARKESKRKIVRNIFLGFAGTHDRSSFRIERMYQALDLLEEDDIILLKRLKELVINPQLQQRIEEYEKMKAHYEGEGKTLEQYLGGQGRKGYGFKQDGYNKVVEGLLEQMDNVERAGIIKTTRANSTTYDGQQDITYRVTPFGVQFCEFIEEDSIKAQ